MPGFDLEFGRVVYVITDQKESMAHLSCQHWQRPPRWQYWVSSRICSRRKSLLLYKWSKEWNRSSWLWSRLFACWSCCLMAQSSDPAPLRVNVHMKSSLGGGGRTSNAIEINKSAWIVFLLYTLNKSRWGGVENVNNFRHMYLAPYCKGRHRECEWINELNIRAFCDYVHHRKSWGNCNRGC